MSGNQVSTAMTILLEEIKNVMDEINQEGSNVFQNGNYERARELTEKGKQLDNFHNKVKDLQEEWDSITERRTILKIKRRKRKREGDTLKKGTSTPEDAYRIPILQALEKIGGSGATSEVIDLVGEIMHPLFNEYDFSPLPSYPKTPRWRNRTAWVRFHLVKEGLLSANSPIGTWEITEKGKKWLAENEELT